MLYNGENEELDSDPLCCCEYIDRNNERNHILMCFCNCVQFDDLCERLISCRNIPKKLCNSMLLTFQDRIRLPWIGGAKMISIDNILPIIFLITSLMVAAINMYCSIVVFIALPVFLCYMMRLLGRVKPKTNFFCLWLIGSAGYLMILFEFTVPLLELLPEENFAFILLMTTSLFCFYKTHQKAPLNHVAPNKDFNDPSTAVLISDREDDETEAGDGHLACQTCRKYIPPRTYHCKVCQVCVTKQDHHNLWLNCCVGRANHLFYFFGCGFAILALLLLANLSLTSICHPFPIFIVLGVNILLPDDCSDIYEQYEIALCFVGSLYALLVSLFIMVSMLNQTYLISKGITMTEWQRGEYVNRRNCFLNWKQFFFG